MAQVPWIHQGRITLSTLSGYPCVVLAPIAGLLAYTISQVVLAQTMPNRGPYLSLRRGFLVGLVVTFVVTARSMTLVHTSWLDFVGYASLNVLTYLALAFGYFNFVNLTVASLRIRLLEELLDAGGHLSAVELQNAYNADAVANLRLDRLVRGGHLIERRGRLLIGRKPFMIVARIFDFLHWFIIDCGHSGKHD